LLVLAGLIAAPLAFGAPAAVAQAGCAHIQNTFAYNECLARQAPPRAERVRGPRRGGDPEASVRGRAADPDAGLATRGVSISRNSGRRVRAVIDPWSGARAPTTVARKKRR
jgi:hypothetical protein